MTATPPTDAQRAGLATLFKNKLAPRDARPHAPCPYCFLDAVSSDDTSLVTYRCPRGHEFLGTRTQGQQHAAWLHRQSNATTDRNV